MDLNPPHTLCISQVTFSPSEAVMPMPTLYPTAPFVLYGPVQLLL